MIKKIENLKNYKITEQLNKIYSLNEKIHNIIVYILYQINIINEEYEN